jgi:hypothetical protein
MKMLVETIEFEKNIREKQLIILKQLLNNKGEYYKPRIDASDL